MVFGLENMMKSEASMGVKDYPLVNTPSLWTMAIEIVDFPIENGDFLQLC